nr:PREDICTED: E3 ubiquitin-protein ligase TRIM56 [Lepisosteus oculatus]
MAATNVELSAQIEEEFLRCKICFEVYRTPRTLSCLHSFCEPCLKKLLDQRKGTVCCPECRTVTDLQGCVGNAKASFFINSLLDLFRAKTDTQALCSLCPSLGKAPEPASSRCLDCADFLCSSCTQGHRCSKVTVDHSVVSLQDYASGRYDEEARRKQERHCLSHQDPLRFYCATCSTPICRDCRMLEHFPHQVLSMAQALAARRPQLEGLIGSLDGSVAGLSLQEQEVDSAVQRLKEAEGAVRDQISGRVSALVDLLLARKDALCEELSSFVQQQERNYLAIKGELQSHISSARSTRDFSRQVMQMGKDCEILDLESTIQGHIERLQRLQIAAVEKKTPVLFIKEEPDQHKLLTGMLELKFEPCGPEVASQTVDDPCIEAQAKASSPTPAETGNQTPVAPPIWPPEPLASSLPWLHSGLVHNPASIIFIRSFETDDDNSGYYENITGIGLSPGGDIVIADNSNLLIKKIIRNGNVRNTFSTNDTDWDNLKPFSLAVCEDTIYFTAGARVYKITEDDDIAQVCNLRGSHPEYAIAAYQDQYIAVSEGQSCCLSLYDPRGTLEGRVEPDAPLEGKFVFLAVNSREEFVVSMQKSIVVFKRSGEIINTCSSAETGSFRPRSVCIDKWDNIYALEGTRVILLTPRGDFVRELLNFKGQGYSPKLLTADSRGHLIMTDKKGTIRIYKVSL